MLENEPLQGEAISISILKDVTGVRSATFGYKLMDEGPDEPLVNKIGFAGLFLGFEYVLPATGAFMRRTKEVGDIAASGGEVDFSYGCLSPTVGILGDVTNIVATLGVVGLMYKLGDNSWNALAAAGMATKLTLNSIAFSLFELARR